MTIADPGQWRLLLISIKVQSWGHYSLPWKCPKHQRPKHPSDSELNPSEVALPFLFSGPCQLDFNA